MNERIRELARQAETKENGYYFFDREKFAELIVQKCAAEAALMGISNYDNDDIVWACTVIARNIKSRFGIDDENK